MTVSCNTRNIDKRRHSVSPAPPKKKAAKAATVQPTSRNTRNFATRRPSLSPLPQKASKSRGLQNASVAAKKESTRPPSHSDRLSFESTPKKEKGDEVADDKESKQSKSAENKTSQKNVSFAIDPKQMTNSDVKLMSYQEMKIMLKNLELATTGKAGILRKRLYTYVIHRQEGLGAEEERVSMHAEDGKSAVQEETSDMQYSRKKSDGTDGRDSSHTLEVHDKKAKTPSSIESTSPQDSDPFLESDSVSLKAPQQDKGTVPGGLEEEPLNEKIWNNNGDDDTSLDFLVGAYGNDDDDDDDDHQDARTVPGANNNDVNTLLSLQEDNIRVSLKQVADLLDSSWDVCFQYPSSKFGDDSKMLDEIISTVAVKTNSNIIETIVSKDSSGSNSFQEVPFWASLTKSHLELLSENKACLSNGDVINLFSLVMTRKDKQWGVGDEYLVAPADFVDAFERKGRSERTIQTHIKNIIRTAKSCKCNFFKMKVIDIPFHRPGHWSRCFVLNRNAKAGVGNDQHEPYRCIIYVDSMQCLSRAVDCGKSVNQLLSYLADGALTTLPLEVIPVPQQDASDNTCGFHSMLYSKIMHDFIMEGNTITIGDKLSGFQRLRDRFAIVDDQMVKNFKEELLSLVYYMAREDGRAWKKNNHHPDGDIHGVNQTFFPIESFLVVPHHKNATRPTELSSDSAKSAFVWGDDKNSAAAHFSSLGRTKGNMILSKSDPNALNMGLGKNTALRGPNMTRPAAPETTESTAQDTGASSAKPSRSAPRFNSSAPYSVASATGSGTSAAGSNSPATNLFPSTPTHQPTGISESAGSHVDMSAIFQSSSSASALKTPFASSTETSSHSAEQSSNRRKRKAHDDTGSSKRNRGMNGMLNNHTGFKDNLPLTSKQDRRGLGSFAQKCKDLKDYPLRRKFYHQVQNMRLVQDATTYNDPTVKKQSAQFKTVVFTYDETVVCLHTAGGAERRPTPLLGALWPEIDDKSWFLEKIVDCNLEEVKQIVEKVEKKRGLVEAFPDPDSLPSSLRTPESFDTTDPTEFAEAFIVPTPCCVDVKKKNNDQVHATNKAMIQEHGMSSASLKSPSVSV